MTRVTILPIDMDLSIYRELTGLKNFHGRLNKTEGALHSEIGEKTSRPTLKPRLPRDIFLQVHGDQSEH